MQNLPITPTTQPVTPAQAPSPMDNNATQAAESFDSVLARQRANADESKPGTDTRDKGQPTSSSPSSPSTDSASAATSNELEIPVTDVVNALPGDMLAALLPVTTNTNSVVASKKTVPQAPIPDGVSTLPSDMLAALLSTPATIQQQSTSAATQQSIAVDVQGGARQQSIAVDVQGGTRQQSIAVDAQGGARQQSIVVDAQDGTRQQSIAVDAQGARQQLITTDVQGGTRQQPITTDIRNSVQRSASAGQSVGEQAASSLSRAQGNPMSIAVDTNAIQGKTFSSALETLGKDAANKAASATTQISTQAVPDASTLVSQAQNTISPVATSTNGSAQAVVNTPVTHDAWGNEFNQKITWLATQHEQTAELHLNPPHLGPMDVVLNVSGDQATALFTSPHAAVRDAVEQALPKLREMLADNGITLGNATVSDQSPKEQPTWLTDKQASGNESLSGKTPDAIPVSSSVWPTRRHQGMVDTFA